MGLREYWNTPQVTRLVAVSGFSGFTVVAATRKPMTPATVFAKADVADGDELLTLPLDAALVVPSPFAGEIIRCVLYTDSHTTASAL